MLLALHITRPSRGGVSAAIVVRPSRRILPLAHAARGGQCSRQSKMAAQVFVDVLVDTIPKEEHPALWLSPRRDLAREGRPQTPRTLVLCDSAAGLGS